MKKFTLCLAAVIGLFVTPRIDASMMIEFGPNLGSQLQVIGDGTSATISLTPGTNPPPGNFTTNSFWISNTTGVAGDALGKYGNITGGFTYTKANVVEVGTKQTVDLEATSNQLQLADGNGLFLTADIDGIQVYTDSAVGGINFSGKVNLSNIAYSSSGTNADFQQFLAEASPPGGGIIVISFNFTSNMSLKQLVDAGVSKTNYSGKLTSVPEPGSMGMALSGVALFGLGYYRRRPRQQA